MADNLIEQFFIDIELNTKGVGKQAKQIDKMLDSMGNKAFKREKARNKSLKSDKIRKERDFRAKESSMANKALNSRLKQFKTARSEDGKVRQGEIDSARKVENAKTKQHFKAMTQKSEELTAMKNYYKQMEVTSARTAKRIARQEAQIARVQGTAYYQGLKRSGTNTSQLDMKLASAVKSGNAADIAAVTTEMKSLNREMSRHNKALAGVGLAQKSVTDSTRNMIRSYLSLFALFEGTVAIKRVGQDYEGMTASMLASSGSVEAAAKDMEFINATVDKMGLNLKDTTDAWVKFKFAAQGKISQGQQEDIFTGLSMFGTALKVDDESMKRSQKALIQIDEYCLAA